MDKAINKFDRVVFIGGLNDFVFTVRAKPKMKSRILYIPVKSEKRTKFDIMEQFVRHATTEEIQAGCRL